MDARVRGALEGFAEAVRGSGYRGLVVLHSRSPGGVAAEVVELLGASGGCVVVAPRRLVPSCPGGCRCFSPGGFRRALGLGAGLVVVATDGLLRPSLVAGVSGIVSAGGLLVVAAPPLEEWDPGVGGGGYRGYLLSRLRAARVLFWADADSGRVYAHRSPRGRAGGWARGPGGYRPRGPVPRGLLELAATPGQARALDEFSLFLGSRARSFLVTGDRGRGKSFLLGLAVALAVRRGAVGEAAAVAPEPWALESFFRGLVEGLGALGVGYRVRRRGGDVVAVTGPWFRVAYYPPGEARAAGMLVVDEAAAVGAARLRRLSWRSGRTLTATTVHGYEGSGMVFAHMVGEILPRPLVRVELAEPVRYPPGDPLEEWVYETFLLRAEPGEPPPPERLGGVAYERLDAGRLSRDPGLLRKAYGLLALAHYRTEPDYLLVLLEPGGHTLHMLRAGGSLVAVADTATEEPGAGGGGRLLHSLLRLHAEGAAEARAVRVVRIAVHPSLQRRGLGSTLLRRVEEWARGLGADLVGAVFARHDVLGFWLRAGYTPFYVSPRYNRFTGEKNIAVAKPLTGLGERLVLEAAGELRLKLLLSSHSVYRDLAAEKIAAMLERLPRVEPPVSLARGQARRLCLYLRGALEAEQAMDALYLAAVIALSRPRGVERLRGSLLVLAVARLLQGKPPDEAAEAAGLGLEELPAALREAAGLLAGEAGLDCGGTQPRDGGGKGWRGGGL
ncbi:hypothetical protein CF15_01020 [Pyrodictium occultum]|uniref:tRNA(Met) cytidine acetyltransferase TmcA n=1 Tax=Pyrodictium occultum TaxID=2309 RepID=A0A0V8RU50_PYROC|nr:GNAT family N-acetyltransferase [Pyrodictium occultum]KSW11466.1 hypothetical protein CF15_01020 [Pyrodictium occultum]